MAKYDIRLFMPQLSEGPPKILDHLDGPRGTATICPHIASGDSRVSKILVEGTFPS